VSKSFGQAAGLIRAAEVDRKMPARISSDVRTNLGPSHLNELARLAPNVGHSDSPGVEKDYSRIRATDIERVLKAAAGLTDDGSVSVRVLRKAVDADLGIDRTEKAKETRERREAEAHPDLLPYLRDMAGRLEADLKHLQGVPESGWKRLAESNPETIRCLVEACSALADLLRRTEG
jgi:hypothetical protein